MRRRTISAEESLENSPGFRRVVRTLQRGLGVEKNLEDESPGRRRVVYKDASCPGCFLSFLSVTAPAVMPRHSVEPRDAWVVRCAASNVDRLDPRGLAPGL